MNLRQTPIKRIISDFDGKKYNFPDVDGRLKFTSSDIESKISSLRDVKVNGDGLIGLHFSQKGRESIRLSALRLKYDYQGLDWKTNTRQHPEAIKRGIAGERELSLALSEREWNSFKGEYDGSVVFERFCIHPETGEFFGGREAFHAHQISLYGTYPFGEYVRFSYTGSRNGRLLRSAALLSRAYYNPNRNGEEYILDADREATLHCLALLFLNNLPKDTELFPSAPRDTFLSYGFR